MVSIKAQVVAEFFTLLLSGFMVAYALRYMIKMIGQSYQWGDKSNGIIAIPLAIPQTVVALGMAILLIAVVDTLITLIRTKQPVLSTPDEV